MSESVKLSEQQLLRLMGVYDELKSRGHKDAAVILVTVLADMQGSHAGDVSLLRSVQRSEDAAADKSRWNDTFRIEQLERELTSLKEALSKRVW